MEDKILAVVNGTNVTERDIDINISRMPQELQQQYSTEQGRKNLLEQIVSFELVYNDAVDSGMENDKEYLAQLEGAKKELLTQASIARMMSEINISDSEAEAFYNENKEMFTQPATVTAKHILVDSQDKANSVKAEIDGGKSFEDAAMEYSSCPSKAQGGNLGAFSRGQMVPEFEEAAFKLEPGIVSDPVQTQFGFHLIKVESKNESAPKTFSEVKGAISNRLLQKKQNSKFLTTVDALKKKYKVEIL